LHEHEVRWKPARLATKRSLRAPTDGDLGIEYLNLKEKCVTKDEEASAQLGAPVYKITCAKPHAHGREVSIQGNVPKREITGAAKALTALEKADPRFHLNSQGLHALGDELRQEFEQLSCREQFSLRCKRCRRPKPRAALVRMDISQQFKRISQHRVAGAVSRLGRRVAQWWRCAAVVESEDS
jgi:hypothetical protein